MSEISIQGAGGQDLDDVARLVAEVESYYGGEVSNDDQERARLLTRLLFGDAPVAHVVLARVGEEVTGMASYSFLWPAVGDTHSLYLKELFVRSAYRRKGVATALVRHLEEVCRTEECSRIEWTADRTNFPAQAFYEALGFTVGEDKLFYRLTVSPSDESD